MTIKSIFTTSVAAVALTVGALAFTGDALAKGGGGHGGHSSHSMNYSNNNNSARSMNFKQSNGSHHHHHYRKHRGGGGIDFDGDDGDEHLLQLQPVWPGRLRNRRR